MHHDNDFMRYMYDSETEPSNELEDNISLNMKLGERLRQWALRNKISHNALNDLIRELSLCGIQNLPSDCRSLLKTPRNVLSVEAMGKGQYWHNGLDNCLKEMLLEVNESCVVKLNFHVDGLPVNKGFKLNKSYNLKVY